MTAPAIIPHANDTLRRAEFELALLGERKLAADVGNVRHTVAALVRAIHAEREASTDLAQRAAQRDLRNALARLREGNRS